MVQLQRYLRRTNDTAGERHLPMLNSMFVERFSKFNPYSKDTSFKTYMRWARRSPQLLGFLNIIATDMLSDKIEFFPIDRDSSGRNKVKQAEKFWKDTKGVMVAEETIYDLLICGIGYNWIGKIQKAQMKEFCELILAQAAPELKGDEIEFKAGRMVESLMTNDKSSIAKKLRHIAASTVTMHSDQYDVINYIQRVGVRIKEFSPDEVITFKLMPLDGKVYPFPPMEALLSEIYLLWLISQNYVSFFENGGKPDNVFILPKELAGSKNHKYLIDTLTKYKKIQNKHGNMVFTGDLSIEQLMDIEHQMENKELGLYLVGILAMMYGVPVSRIPFLVGKAAAGGDAGGLADSGYWRKISVWQSKLEIAYNAALWNPYFGVDMQFSRGYLQDEVRETQNDMQRTSVAEQRMRLGLWPLSEAGKYLNIDEEVLEEAQKELKKREAEMMKSGMQGQNLDAKRNIIPNPDKRAKDKMKQDKQMDNKQTSGKRLNA